MMLLNLLFQMELQRSENKMNDNDRRMYRPTPHAGQLKCIKCGAEMKPNSRDPKMSVCIQCGFKATRIKI